MKERVHWIDLSKGIAIILVVIGHVVSSYHEAGLYQDNHLFNFSHQFAYSFHMALFMILSGYLASKGKKRGTRSQQALQKLINYGIPYVIFSVIWVSMKLLMAGHTNSAVSVKDLLFIPVYPISFMWFIYALIFMQVIQVFVNPKSIVGKGIHLLVAWGGYCIQPYLAKSLIEIRFSDCVISDFMKNYIFFLVGVYFAEYALEKIKKNRTLITVISGILLIGGNLVKYGGMANAVTESRVFTFILAICGGLFAIELWIDLRESSVLEYVGKQSLPIYVLQGIAIAASRLLLTKMHLNVAYGIVSLVVCTILGCLLPLCAYWISTKIWKLDGCFYPGRYLKA